MSEGYGYLKRYIEKVTQTVYNQPFGVYRPHYGLIFFSDLQIKAMYSCIMIRVRVSTRVRVRVRVRVRARVRTCFSKNV